MFKKHDPNVSFWKWFSKKEKEYYLNFETHNEQYMAEISEKLKGIDPNLTFEIGTIKGGEKREFIVSADGLADSFEAVENLWEAAPSLLNWTIIKFRPRMNSDDIKISMGNVDLSYEDVYFIPEHRGHYVDLEVYIQDYRADDNHYSFAYFILLDSLIGEFDAVTKIGDTRINPLSEEVRGRAKKFVELTAVIDELHS
ncbi:hypothetical protein [Paenibacillus methanolicus]|uniref:hypothetical protein n=1 Tax=Paenibacillus methanolicus TaxID=582686 RepID=UPI0011E75927|nr:hypothetical protein [Paenibacillus methanolicus]